MTTPLRSASSSTARILAAFQRPFGRTIVVLTVSDVPAAFLISFLTPVSLYGDKEGRQGQNRSRHLPRAATASPTATERPLATNITWTARWMCLAVGSGPLPRRAAPGVSGGRPRAPATAR